MDDRYSSYGGAPTRSGFDFNKPTVVALLYMIGPIISAGVLTLIGLILAYVWKDAGEAPWMRSHFRFHIRTFWYGVLGSLLASAMWFIGLKWLAVIALALWGLARTFLALMKAQRAEPVPNPEALFW